MKSESQETAFTFPTAAGALFPSCVQLTLSHYVCDSACISCPVGRLNAGDPAARALYAADGGVRMFMPWAVFEKAVREAGQHSESFLRFHSRGEPSLHPRFVDMIAFSKRVGVRTVQVFTNGISMDEELSRRTLDAGVDVMEFSVHGHTATYRELMGNDHFERVVENIRRFVTLRDERRLATKIVVSAVDQPGFASEKEAHRQFWVPLADEVILRPFHSWGGRIPPRPVDPSLPRGPCPQLWTRLTVGPTGRIPFCFNAWDEKGSETAADLMEPGMTIAAIWQSERYARVREEHRQGTYTLRCCARCTDWVGSSWGRNSYETLLRRLGASSGEPC